MWLGVLAAVSLFEALIVIALSVAGILVYLRVKAILDDVQKVTSMFKAQTEHLTGLLRWLTR